MRSTVDASLPDTAVIRRSTYVSDGGGGGSVTWNAVGTISCRLAPKTGNERLVADRIAADANWTATFPAQTDVTVEDRVGVGVASFEVVAVSAPRSFELSRRADLNEIV
jgi:head-tail adaptor